MLTMRITGGKYCGRKVIIPNGELEIRPAMDRMRESLFIRRYTAAPEGTEGTTIL